MNASDRVFPATPDKLRAARRLGDHPTSRFSVAVGASLTIAGAIVYSGADGVESLQALLRQALRGTNAPMTSTQLAVTVAKTSLPWLGLGGLAALTLGLLQTRGQFAMPAMRATWQERISQWSRSLGRAGRAGLGSLLLVLALSYAMEHLPLADLGPAVGNLPGTLQWLGEASTFLWATFAGGAASLALVDAAVCHWLWLRRNRMTASELESEQKNSQANPQLRHLRQQTHLQALRETDLSRLSLGRLLVSGPDWLTTVLGYDPGRQGAPTVLLQGAGAMGRVIQACAHANRMARVEDPALSRKLSVVAPDEEIPSDCFEAVALALARTTPPGDSAPLGPPSHHLPIQPR